MSVKKVCLATLVTALLGLGAVRGQSTNPSQYTTTSPGGLSSGMPGAPGAAPGSFSTRPADTAGATGDATQPGLPVNLSLSDWIVGPHGPGCCGPVGGCGPIQEEIYLQSGLDFPFSDGVFGHTLKKDGWVIQGGGRTLFFNPEQDAAWVADISISNVHDQGRNPSYEVPLRHILVPTATASQFSTFNFAIVDFVPRATLNRLATHKNIQTLNPQIKNFKKYNGEPLLLNKGANKAGPDTIAAQGVSIEDLNRTFFNVGFGRDWYLFGEAPTYLNRGCGENGCGCGGPVWRIGVDGGGRYGTAKLEVNQVRHRTDTIAAMYVGAHSDVEVPCGCCIFQAGIRVEYDYTWMDILQEQNDADVQGINLLFTIGTRF
jgi:hypothetical protein